MAEQGLSRQERLARQRKGLKSKLGLGGPIELMDTSELVKDEDLVADSGAAARKEPTKAAQKTASALLSDMTGQCRQRHDLLLLKRLCHATSKTLQTCTGLSEYTDASLVHAGLSAREKNQLKRKLKQQATAAAAGPNQAKRTKADAAAATLVWLACAAFCMHDLLHIHALPCMTGGECFSSASHRSRKQRRSRQQPKRTRTPGATSPAARGPSSGWRSSSAWTWCMHAGSRATARQLRCARSCARRPPAPLCKPRWRPTSPQVWLGLDALL